MKKFFSLLFLFCTLSGGAQQKENWYSVKAFLPDWEGALVKMTIDEKPVYTARVEKDMFAFNGVTTNAKQAVLEIRKEKRVAFVPFFIEPGTIKIRDAGSKVLVPYNTASNDVYFQLIKQFDSLALLKQEKNFAASIQYKRQLAVDFIRDHPSSIVSLQLLKDYFYLQPEADDTLYHSLFYSLHDALREMHYAKKMKEEADIRNVTALGRTAPNLVIQDTAKNSSRLYEIGGYTLIDFWASWCLPCRKENPRMMVVYKKYSSKGFKITGVSLDTNKYLWMHAIKKDGLAWKQLSDLKGWDGAPVLTYGIKTIPMNYLVNDKGIIIARNLYPDQLDRILTAIYPL